MPPKNIIQSPFVTQRGLSIADVRSLAQNEPENFLQKIQTGAEAGTFRLDQLHDLKSLYQGLADVEVSVPMRMQDDVVRSVSTSAFPILVGTATIAQINEAFAGVESIGQNLVTEFDHNKKVTTMVDLRSLDKDQDEVKERKDFPEIGVAEEKVEIRHRKNGRKITFSLESIMENDLPDIVGRSNRLGEIANEHIEELTLYRVTDHYGSGSSPAEPYAYRPNGTGTQLYNATANSPGTRAPSGTRITTNPFVDESDLENARVRLATMLNERGRRITIPRSQIIILCPDAIVGSVLKVLNSEMVPGVENEMSNWGPKGKWHIPIERVQSSPKMDDMSTSAWYYGAFKEQFKRKWKMRFELITLGTDTQAYLNAQIAFQARLAWDVEVGAISYERVIQSLNATTAPVDE